jgi:hypothetical protein
MRRLLPALVLALSLLRRVGLPVVGQPGTAQQDTKTQSVTSPAPARNSPRRMPVSRGEQDSDRREVCKGEGIHSVQGVSPDSMIRGGTGLIVH